MSTHRRAWKQRAGVVVALVVGALFALPATPALAADVSVSPRSVTVNAGSDATVTVQINPSIEDKSAQISLSGLPSGVSCSGGCGNVQFNGPPGSSKSQLLTIKASDNAGDATTTVTVRVEPDGSDPGTATFSLTVKGKAAPPEVQTVRSVSGKVVVQATGDPVPGAYVALQDSNNHRYETTTDGSGNFRFTGTSDRPITPGRIEIGASSDDIRAVKSFTASAGQAVTGQRINLAIKVEVTPSATPSATEEALPTDEATDETTEETPEATEGAAANASNEDSGGGMGQYLVILLGGLLVAAGVGTIVLLWMKRKENPDDAGDDAPAGAGAAGAVPAAHGAFRGADDHTRVVNRAGAGADPTMVGGAALSEAPTMMHRPVVDDVPPDPYGAPPQQYGAGGSGWAGNGYGDEPAGYGAGGYGNAPSSGGGYGNAPGSGGYGAGGGDGYGANGDGGYGNGPAGDGGYGAAPSSGGGYGGAPSSGGGYGSRDYGAPAGAAGYPPASGGGAGGYGERYDEPTGRYTGDSTQYPAPADPYATGLYEQGQGQGYGQSETAPYGRGAEPAGGYDQRGGYDQGGYGQQGGGYGQEPSTQRGGYDDRGYGDQGGYGQQGGGYGQEPPTQRGGYDDRGYGDQGGYGQQGGGYGDQNQGGRGRDGAQDRGGRRLDWLDD